MGRSKKYRGQIRQQRKPTKAEMAGMDPVLVDILGRAQRRGIKTVYEGGDDDGVGWVYSHNHGNGRAEFYVPKVPKAKAKDVEATICFLALTDHVGHRQSVRGYGELLFWLNLVEGEKKKQLLETKCQSNGSADAPLYELRPRFECKPTDSWWGCREPSPDGMEEMTDAILRKWEEQGKFRMMKKEVEESLRHFFHDGVDVMKDHIIFPESMYKSVDLACALRHIDDWEVDWDKELTVEEVQYVRDHTKYFRDITRVLFRDKLICEHCGKVEGKLLVCSGCRSANYCSQACQLADRKDHKEKCKHIKALRTDYYSKETMNQLKAAAAKSEEEP